MTKLILTVGAPGSGKSTWAEKFCKDNPGIIYLSSDRLRAVFGTGEDDQSVSARVFKELRYMVGESLAKGYTVLVDSTAMFPKRRKEFLDIAKMYKAETEAHVFEVDREELIKRNKERKDRGGRDVGVDVIDMMLGKYVRPTSEEFTNIIFH